MREGCAFTIKMQQLTFSVVGESTLVINYIAGTIYPHAVFVAVKLEFTIREVHITIREEPTKVFTIHHVDGASRCLETMVVDITPIEGDVLECSAIGRTCNAAVCCSIGERNTIHSTFESNVQRQVRQCVVICFKDFDGLSSSCGSNSISDSRIEFPCL